MYISNEGLFQNTMYGVFQKKLGIIWDVPGVSENSILFRNLITWSLFIQMISDFYSMRSKQFKFCLMFRHFLQCIALFVCFFLLCVCQVFFLSSVPFVSFVSFLSFLHFNIFFWFRFLLHSFFPFFLLFVFLFFSPRNSFLLFRIHPV